MINWRKPIVNALLKLQGSRTPAHANYIRSIEHKSPQELTAIQNHRLSALLRYAWQHTDYYRKILSNCGAVHNGDVDIEKFNAIPLLTKEIIRKHQNRLTSNHKAKGSKPFVNHTGGSTGEPIRFQQDNIYWDWNVANKIFYLYMAGKEVGEPEMKIWGSERDLFEGTIGIGSKLKFFLYNRMFVNSFHLTDEKIENIVDQINSYQPKVIWGYVDALYTIAGYVKKYSLKLHSPAAVFCAAGTLYKHMAESIEKAFGAKAINVYGSREMGDIACQCPDQKGLHIFSHTHIVETVDECGKNVVDQEGEIIVTSLMNLTMPFIRYRIGDRGVLSSKQCSCGRAFPLLESVAGRVTDVFHNSKEEVIPAEYFIHLIGVVYNSGFIKKFQVIQNDYDEITVKLILNEGYAEDSVQDELNNITDKIKLVMGEECRIGYTYVTDIPETESGKYQYTLSKLTVPKKVNIEKIT